LAVSVTVAEPGSELPLDALTETTSPAASVAAATAARRL
jgi:hypothetical protein